MSTGVKSARVRIIVVGAGGRMGARICALAHADDAFELIGALESAGSPHVARESAPQSARGAAPKITDSPGVFGPSSADAVIDFSSDAGAATALEAARRSGAALLVGTTALSDRTLRALRDESAHRAVLVSANMSLGVALSAALVRQAAATLAGYECAIIEAHHSAKKDAPSGTALRLASSAREGGATLPDAQIVSIRGGDVVGEHTVRFAGPGEYIEIVHRATSRDVFVRGALRAAAWLKGRRPAWYTMEDLLGLPAR
jgi:4-hydroxy-tetrahydrodipicolinate reductase